MSIHLYTLCWNEMDILPFVIDYWKRLPITKAVVYDNGSTDGSIEYLKQYDWIEVRHFDTEGMNDTVHKQIKNTCWKESKGKADWVIVCDIDELIYSTDDINNELQYMKDNGYNIMGMPWYAMCFDVRPQHDPSKLLHKQGNKFYKQRINYTHRWSHLGKFMLFDPNVTDDMCYTAGCHEAHPKPIFNVYESNKTFNIHINKGFSEDYFVERRKVMAQNLSQENKSHRYGWEYDKSEESSRQEYRNNQNGAVDVNEIYHIHERIIDIVTINLNNKDGLRKTIESVINQTYFDKIHYIIIDGGSTDGSVDVIKEYADKIDYWVSEKDSGLYNAMNKGVDQLIGEYCLFLNSGDYLADKDRIQLVFNELDKDIVYGNEYKKKDGRIVETAKYPHRLDEQFFKMTALPHQSTFIRTSLMKEHKYDENNKLLGDWRFFREMIMVHKVSYKHIDTPISVYGLDGLSTINRSLHEREKKEYYSCLS